MTKGQDTLKEKEKKEKKKQRDKAYYQKNKEKKKQAITEDQLIRKRLKAKETYA